jgi:hypothetical protein
MNERFVDWYGDVSANPSPERLERRWRAIEAIAAPQSRMDVLDLVRIAVGQTAKRAGFRDSVNKAIREHDSTFNANAAVETRILCAAALTELFKSESKFATLASLALQAADWFGSRKGEFPKFALVEARNHNALSGEDLRKDRDYPKKLRSLKFSRENVEPTWPTTSINEVERIFKWTKDVAETTSAWIGESESRTTQLREEIDILWWLVSAYSRDLGVPLKKIPKASRSLVVAKEIADMVRRLPGPLGALGVMERALDGEKNDSSALDAIKNAPDSWKALHRRSDDQVAVHDLCPVTAVIDRATDSTVEAGTLRQWSIGLFGDVVTDSREPIAIALQFYNERLLSRAYEEAGAGEKA